MDGQTSRWNTKTGKAIFRNSTGDGVPKFATEVRERCSVGEAQYFEFSGFGACVPMMMRDWVKGSKISVVSDTNLRCIIILQVVGVFGWR